MVSDSNIFLSSTEPLIGRDREIAVIQRFLASKTLKHRVLFFEGEGGIGKTRLLTEAMKRARERSGMLACDIIDLYLAQYHQPVLIMDAIVRSLRLELSNKNIPNDVFAGYDKMVSNYLLTSDGDSVDIEQKRIYIEQEFIREYSNIAKKYMIVLFFDTFEKLFPYIAETEEFNYRRPSRLERWIVNIIKFLPNTLTIIAGRHRGGQQDMLKEQLGQKLLVKRILPFTQNQDLSFLVDIGGQNKDEIEQNFQTLYKISQGRPIILAVIQALLRSKVIDIIALPPGFDDASYGSGDQLSSGFFQLIITRLYQDWPGLADLLAKLFICGKA